MKTTEINIRDPYILVHGSKYYLYGTRSATCWGPADGFDCYVSEDKENWEGPIEIFHTTECDKIEKLVTARRKEKKTI